MLNHNTIHISQIYLIRALTLVFHSAFILKPSTVRQTHTSPQVENTPNPAKVKKKTKSINVILMLSFYQNINNQ